MGRGTDKPNINIFLLLTHPLTHYPFFAYPFFQSLKQSVAHLQLHSVMTLTAMSHIDIR